VDQSDDGDERIMENYSKMIKDEIRLLNRVVFAALSVMKM
jgi:hypothetical protein